MRFLSAKTIHEYIPKQFLMRRWGGTIDFVYVHKAEERQRPSDDDSILEVTGTTDELMTNHNNNTILLTTPKKVSFMDIFVANG